LNQRPIAAETTEELAAETRRRYQAEIYEQQTQAATRVREQSLMWDNERSNRALEAVIAEAIRTQPLGMKVNLAIHLQATPQLGISTRNEVPQDTPIEVEVEVHSKNELFQGRIDRAERTENGIRLVDYKSAFRDDLPERYTRQLQLYAYLWQEARGEWPSEAFVFYPMLGKFHNVPVDSGICLQVITESIMLVEKIEKSNKPTALASPGDVCKVCEFRPWCRPFWAWQAAEGSQLRAVDRANIGFEGEIKTIKLENHYWILNIAWHNAQVKIISPQERFPHLVNALAGQTVRVLDTNLKGQLFQPTANVNNQSEIFIVTS
jgi:CRISPR/Cas system-associated exonuclease Cas4 (RecB family)